MILSNYDPRHHPADRLLKATWRDRFIAQLVDSIVLWLPVLALIYIFSSGTLRTIWFSPIIPVFVIEIIGNYKTSTTSFLWGGSLLNIPLPGARGLVTHYPAPLLWVIYIGYYTALTTANGQTIGKRAKHLVVLDSNGNTPSLQTSFKRWAAYLISVLPFGYGVWDLFSKSPGKALHDQICGTDVFQYDWEAGL